MQTTSTQKAGKPPALPKSLGPKSGGKPGTTLATCTRGQLRALDEIRAQPVQVFVAVRRLGLSRRPGRELLREAGLLEACAAFGRKMSREKGRTQKGQPRVIWRKRLAEAIAANQSAADLQDLYGIDPRSLQRRCELHGVRLRNGNQPARWLEPPEEDFTPTTEWSGRLRAAYAHELTEDERRLVDRLHARATAEIRAGR